MSTVKNEKMIIIGKSGSGKDHLMRELIKKGLKPCVKYTTRPQRKNEIQGVNYNFISESEFQNLLNGNKFITTQNFTVTPYNKDPEIWHYGITKEDFEISKVFIMTPGEFSNIDKETRKKCFVVYLDIDRVVREHRLFKREDKNDSIKRRLDADEIDFKEFNDYDLKVNDPEFETDDIYDLMF